MIGPAAQSAQTTQAAQSAQTAQAADSAMVYVSHEFSPQAGQAANAPPIPLPPLRIIALTRLAFGPSLNGSEGWGAGATAEEQFTNWVTTQLNPNLADDPDCNARIAAGNLPTLNKTLVQMWTDHMNNPTQNQDFRRDDPANDVYFATFIRAIYSKWQLFQVLADFWHNHFNIYAWDYEYAASTFVQYDRDVIRANALGNFRTMLEAVAKSPAMLFYLDNYINTVAGPNENWAREMFELHTMGAENYAGVVPRESVPGYATGNPEKYCDGDVYESTRCFTGWRVNDEKKEGNPSFRDDGTFMYDATRHDRFQKIVLAGAHPETWANEAEKDGKVVLDKVCAHPGTGRYIVRKLWRRLIGDNTPRPYKGAPEDPPPAPGTDLAHDFLEECAAYWTSLWQDPQQIQKVVFKLLTDPKSPFKTTFGEKIKRPYEAAVSMLRAVGAEWKPKRDFWDFFNAYELMGQDLFSRRPPDGYPDVKGAWNNTTSILMRWRFCNWMLEEGVPKDRPEIQVDLNDDTLAAFPAQAGRTPNAVADYWIGRILGRAMMNTESRKAVVDMLSRGANPATYQLNNTELKERIHDAIALILMSPDFQLR
jgi:uncharacterized protein (DUF1800 family)